MTFPNRPWLLPLELLDAVIWDCPARLSADDCLYETGPDWRWTQAQTTDPEDDR